MAARCLLIAAVFAFSGLRCASAGQMVVNEEYGFEATTPEGFPTCFGLSGSHIHGVYTRLDGKGCDDPRGEAYLSFWADYNAGFKPSVRAYMSGSSACKGTRPSRVGVRLSIGGLPTWRCVRKRENGSREMVLVAATGRWDAGFETTAPHLIYTLSFGTTEQRQTADQALFDAFRGSIVLRKPR